MVYIFFFGFFRGSFSGIIGSGGIISGGSVISIVRWDGSEFGRIFSDELLSNVSKIVFVICDFV